eukprot:13407418-Heterocapsa_arctica.AAC.1
MGKKTDDKNLKKDIGTELKKDALIAVIVSWVIVWIAFPQYIIYYILGLLAVVGIVMPCKKNNEVSGKKDYGENKA